MYCTRSPLSSHSLVSTHSANNAVQWSVWTSVEIESTQPDQLHAHRTERTVNSRYRTLDIPYRLDHIVRRSACRHLIRSISCCPTPLAQYSNTRAQYTFIQWHFAAHLFDSIRVHSVHCAFREVTSVTSRATQSLCLCIRERELRLHTEKYSAVFVYSIHSCTLSE